MASLSDRIVGAWELVSYRIISADSSVTYPLGEDATGFIIYTPDGYMSAQLMRAGRAAYGSGDPHAGTASEMSAAAAGYIAYSGPFFVDEASGTLRHQMSVCLFPNWIGNTQIRICRLVGDALTLATAAPMTVSGILATPTLEWRRAPGNLGP